MIIRFKASPTVSCCPDSVVSSVSSEQSRVDEVVIDELVPLLVLDEDHVHAVVLAALQHHQHQQQQCNNSSSTCIAPSQLCMS